jgi:hypothetical protein
MSSSESIDAVVQIGVFARPEGWLMTHPAVESRFERHEDALAAARRLAHLESWRGRPVTLRIEGWTARGGGWPH